MHFKMSSATCFNLGQSKTLSSGNGLNQRIRDHLLKETTFITFPWVVSEYRLYCICNESIDMGQPVQTDPNVQMN